MSTLTSSVSQTFLNDNGNIFFIKVLLYKYFNIDVYQPHVKLHNMALSEIAFLNLDIWTLMEILYVPN